MEEALVSFVPTGMTYYSALMSIGNTYIAIGLSIVVFLCFLFVLYQKNVGIYKKALAEILAVGYFKNFVENLSRNLNLDELNILQFEGENKSVKVPIERIHIEILIPSSLSLLDQLSEELNDTTIHRVYFGNRLDRSAFWARALREDENIIIKDFPRTLYSLQEYVVNEFKSSYSEKTSKKYHRAFIETFQRLMARNSQNNILRKFTVTIVN